jgi:tRNA(adenine34) deaminase
MEAMNICGDVFTPLDLEHMQMCLSLAREGLDAGEFPAACIITDGVKVVASARNCRHLHKSKLAHAELLAIRAAEPVLGPYLKGCTVYVSVEPCLMCFAALCACRASRVVFGAFDNCAGVGDLAKLPPHYRHFAPQMLGGCLASGSYDLVAHFAAATAESWPLEYYRAPAVA